jgi:transposase
VARSARRVIVHVARELGIHPEAMRTWIRQDEADRGERGDRQTTAELEALRRLRKENLKLRRQRDDPQGGEGGLNPALRHEAW